MRSHRIAPLLLGLFAILMLQSFVTPVPRAAAAAANTSSIDRWSQQWIDRTHAADTAPPTNGDWLPGRPDKAPTLLPQGIAGVWLRLDVPPTSGWRVPGLLAKRLYGLEITVYENGQVLYESKRDNRFERNRLLMPMDRSDETTTLYIRVLSANRAGLDSSVQIGEIGSLDKGFVRQGFPDLLFGTALAVLGFIMLLCSGYLTRSRRRFWIALSSIAMSVGCLFFTYSPLPYVYFERCGNFFLFLFDISLVVLFPSLNAYVRQIFEGKYPVFTFYSKVQAGYSAICIPIVLLYYIAGERYEGVYDFFTVTLLGLLVLIQMILIAVLAARNAFRGQKDAIILSVGLLALAVSGVLDLACYYLSDFRYVLVLWKFGVAVLFLALVLLFARRVSADYAILLNYSKELELYNHRLQRSEKIKIIGDLAASVAHEVRNPLQVTRGFLQLLSRDRNEKEATYCDLAVQELDRASTIITDFLTFARPELDTIEQIDAAKELRSVESIIQPLAAMNGSELLLRLEEPLWIAGNSSKFKQAFINIIKNSIEAVGTGGKITIAAYSEDGSAVIRITDNGEGMSPEQLAKLGVPFFSTKTKGTGLGLMVTFRIIEVMKGTLEFRSKQGEGTEATARFPLSPPSSVPDTVRT